MALPRWLYRPYAGLLARLERRLGIDMRYYFHNGLWLSFGQGASSAASAVLGIGFANLLAPSEFGVYEYVLSIVQAVSAVALPETGTAVVQSVSRGDEGAVRPALETQRRWALLAALGALCVSAYALWHGRRAEGLGLLVAAVLFPFYCSYALYDAVLRGRRDFRRSTSFAVLFQLGLSLSLLVGLLLRTNAVVLVAIYFGMSTLMRALFFRRVSPREDLEPSSVPETLSFAKHLSLMKGINQAAGAASQVLLYHLLGPAALSMFVIGIAPAEQVRGWLALLGQLLFAKASSDDWNVPQPGQVLRKSAPLLLGVIALCAAYYAAAPALFSLLFPRYVDVVPASRLYIFSLVFTAVGIPLTFILKAKRAIRDLHIQNLLSSGLSLALALPMTYLYGLYGLMGSIIAIKVVEDAWLSYAVFYRLPSRKPSRL